MNFGKTLLLSLPMASTAEDISELTDRDLWKLLHGDDEQNAGTVQTAAESNSSSCNDSIPEPKSLLTLIPFLDADHCECQSSSLPLPRRGTTISESPVSGETNLDQSNTFNVRTEFSKTRALCDAAVLRNEHRRQTYPVQEAWLRQGLRYQRWDEALLRRGAAYRANPIASRTTFSMSHTKSLCISFNMDTSLLYATDVVVGSPDKAPAETGEWAPKDGSNTSSRAVPLFMWQSPQSIPSDVSAVLPQLSEQLKEQYSTLAQRPLFTTVSLNQRAVDLGQALDRARKEAGTSKVIFHYCARGLPKPRDGNIFLTTCLPSACSCPPLSNMSLDMVRARAGFPLVFIADCAGAGTILDDFILKRDEQEQQHQFLSREHQLLVSDSRPVSSVDLDTMADGGRGASASTMSYTVPKMGSTGLPQATTVSSLSTTGGIYDDFFFIGASGSSGRQATLPHHDRLPSDILTSCLTTPLRLAMTWFMVKQHDLIDIHPILLQVMPGSLQDKKTPLGQLQWHFQCITECIAWSSFPLSTFSRLFRDDIYVAPLFRGYLLAEHVIVGGLGGTMCVYPPLTPTHDHPFWDSWENLLERTFMAVLRLVRPAPPTCLTTLEFREWLDVRATKWKYTQSATSIQPHGTTLPRLPTFDETRPLNIQNFLLEELQGIDAIIERVTAQSFVVPITSKKRLLPHPSDANHSTNKWNSQAFPKNFESSAGSPSMLLVHNPLRNDFARWRRPYENESLRYLKSKLQERRSEDNIDTVDFAKSKHRHESQNVPTSMLSTFSNHLHIKANSHANDTNVPLSATSYSISATSKPFSAGNGSGSTTTAAEYVGNMCALPSASNTPASGAPVPFPFIKRMPYILQGLLVMAYRERATSLVCRLVDAGAPAVLQCAEANLYRFVLDRYWVRPDLRYMMPTTLFIYSKSYYVDPELVGSSAQRSNVIKACVEVLQCPIKLHGVAITGSFATAECAAATGYESGAWQWKFLGFYSSPQGQRLLACSILSILSMHSDDARETCHRLGAFQLVCQLLEEVFLHEDAHDFLLPALQQQQQGQQSNPTLSFASSTHSPHMPHMRAKCNPAGDSFDSFPKMQVPMSSHNVDWRTITTLYRVTLMTLFVALLHNWSPSSDGESEVRSVDDAVTTQNSLEDGDKKQEPLKPTSARSLRDSLQVVLGALEQSLYSSTPVVRGTALRALSMVIISPAADDTMKRRFAASLLSHLNNASSLRFEGNTDLRLEATGVAFVLYKFLMKEASKGMSQDEIRCYVTQWLYKYESAQLLRQKGTEERASNVDNVDPPCSLARPPSSRAATAGMHTYGALARPSKPPASISVAKPRLSFRGIPPEPQSLQWIHSPQTYNNRNSGISVAPSTSLFDEFLRSSDPFLAKSETSALESQVLFSLSNLVRLVLELTQDPCPHVAAHACKIVLEEMASLFEDVAPSLRELDTVAETTIFPHSVDTYEGPSGTYRAQSNRSRSVIQKRWSDFPYLYRQQNLYSNSTLASKSYLESDICDPTSTDELQGNYIVKLFYKSMHNVKKMRSQINHSSGVGSEMAGSGQNANQHHGNFDDEDDKLKSNSPFLNYTASLDCFRDGGAELNTGSSKSAMYSAMLPENITLRALSAEDSTTVSMFVHTSLSFIDDLLLIKTDDSDPRNPFSQQKASDLHAYMLVLAREISSGLLQSKAGFLSATSEYCNGERKTKRNHTSSNMESYCDVGCSDQSKVSNTEQEEVTSERSFRIEPLGANTVSKSIAEMGSIHRLLFHPASPHFIASTDSGVIQCWDYSKALMATGGGFEPAIEPVMGSLKMTVCFKTDAILARPPFAVPRGAQLQRAYTSTPWSSSIDLGKLKAGGKTAANHFGLSFNNGSLLQHAKPGVDPIDGIHLVDVAYRPLLCAVHRTGVVELFSGYEHNGTALRVSTFCSSSPISVCDLTNSSHSTPDASPAVSLHHGCLSSYQEQSKLLYLCNSGDEDTAIMPWDLSCERMTLGGYGRGDCFLGPPSILTSHPYDASLFAVGAAASVHLYDRRRPGPKAAKQFDFSVLPAGTTAASAWKCSHAHFSCRFPNLLVAGFQPLPRPKAAGSGGSSALWNSALHCTALVLWDDRHSRQPLNVFYHQPHPTPTGVFYPGEGGHPVSDANGTPVPSVIDVQPFSRHLCSLIVDEGNVALTEWGLQTNPIQSQWFNGFENTLSAARLHPFLPLVALGCGSQVMLLGGDRRA